MKKQILLLISISLFLFTLSFTSAAILNRCGDGYCDTNYSENNIRSTYYCPQDCGIPDRNWCDETYPRDCPTCPVCSGSGGSAILSGECSTTCPFPFVENLAFFNITGSKCKDGLIILGVIVLIFGVGSGIIIKSIKKHKKR